MTMLSSGDMLQGYGDRAPRHAKVRAPRSMSSRGPRVEILPAAGRTSCWVDHPGAESGATEVVPCPLRDAAPPKRLGLPRVRCRCPPPKRVRCQPRAVSLSPAEAGAV